MEEYYVYEHVNSGNGKRYIGITKQKPEQRWGHSGINYKSSPYFWSAICKYGWDSFEHNVLYSNLSQEDACEIERKLILEYKTQDKMFGYNIMEGGVAPTIPQEVRQRMSNAMRGNQNGLGKPCSDEKKRKISEAQRGRRLTKEHRAKLSAAKKGKTHKSPSDETKKKISDSHKKNPVICTETQTVYPSIQECARQLEIPATTICACCKGRIKSIKGLHFQYYNNDMKMPNDYPKLEYA